MLSLYRHHHHHRLFISISRARRRAASTALAAAPTPHDDYNYEHEPEPDDQTLSDAEWDARAGAAIDTLTRTLPHFLEQGLRTRTDSSLSSLTSLTGFAKSRDAAPSDDEKGEQIYDSRVRLSYTPPAELPAPLPRTLHVDGEHFSTGAARRAARRARVDAFARRDVMHGARPSRLVSNSTNTTLPGLPLYLASSMLLRHSLHALYTPLTLTVTSVRVSSTRPPGSGPSIPSLPPSHRPGESAKHERAYERQKSLTVGFDIDGRGRVGGGKAHWEIRSTYHFHPMHARIYRYVFPFLLLLVLPPSTLLISYDRHVVDSIVPAPSSGVFDLLRGVLDGVGGRVGVPGVPGGCVSIDGGPRCDAVIKARKSGRWEGLGGVGGSKGCR